MKYCDNCGYELVSNTNFCPKCGNVIKLNKNTSKNTSSIVVCAIIGLIFPIVGAILYYVLKNKDHDAARVANICSWIGFLLPILVYLLFGFSILRLF